jgi:tetratricopeptide (TPR) repeat protein
MSKSSTAGPQAATLSSLYDDEAAKTKYEPIHLTASNALSSLTIPLAQEVFGHNSHDENIFLQAEIGDLSYTDFLSRQVQESCERSDAESNDLTVGQRRSQLLHIGLAALFSFLQSNVSGPPLEFSSAERILPLALRRDASTLGAVRSRMIRDLSVDGEAAYQLTPNVELFCVAKVILVDADVVVVENAPLAAQVARMRVNFVHQKMLSEVSGTLQKSIYDDLNKVSQVVLGGASTSTAEERARFLLERAIIHTHHGFDVRARADLGLAATETGFEYALTGRLGKRTKFQDRDISQLVVLAKSADEESVTSRPDTLATKTEEETEKSKPKTLDLDDDTLLESISFAKEEIESGKSTTVQDESSLPPALASIDPSKQPKLSPLDSGILLAIASAITNNSPEHGLTREETLPYATRVIEGGSANWQIYTQALLVRSRIEGYRSRTVERGVLQMQALVDQVIADTATSDTTVPSSDTVTSQQQGEPTTFLPRPEQTESAPAEERLEYIWTLNFSTRWSLEAELASRWVNIGGLRTALDIYERLHMWAEVALCYAATEREEKAKAIVRRQLYEPTNKDSNEEDDNEKYEGAELATLPADAPRLFCILGDIDNDEAMYERAWEVSNQRYARAQRSLARLYLKAQPPALDKAESAYRKSLKINPLNHGAWFAMGCVQLNLEQWGDAIESFTRTVQLEDNDAEAWSNLAAALLQVSSDKPAEINSEAIVDVDHQKPTTSVDEDSGSDEPETKPAPDPFKPRRDALTALHHAARLKQTDHRIWDNLLTVATSLPPPLTPYKDIVFALRKVVELLGPKKGEKSVDLSVLTLLVDHLVKNFEYEDLLIPVGDDSTAPDERHMLRSGTVPGQIISLIDQIITPLITHSAPLWLLVARVELFRGRPSKAFEAHEKAWRAVVASSTQGAFQMGDEKRWMDVVKATERLVRDGYAKIGGMEKEGHPGELVAKDWRFKARSAVRSIMGKGKELWEGSEGWLRLKELASEVSGGV